MIVLAATVAHQLLRVVVSSFLATVATTVLFAIAILGATRAGEAHRSGRSVAATGLGAVAAVALLVFAGVVAYGLHVLLST
jgi:hypothetical protein